MRKQMFRSLALMSFLAALALTPAFAVDVTYSTTGSFTSCGVGFTCVGNVLTGPNNLRIVFDGTVADFPNVSVPPVTYAPFGTFTATGPNPGATDTVAATFQLKVTQTVPVPGGTETLLDTVKGNIKIANSQVTVVFTSGSGSGGVAVNDLDPLNGAAALRFTMPPGVIYWVDKVTPIHPQTGSGTAGTSIINGAIDTTVPEPAFYALTGTGFAGLLFMAVRRRRQKA